MEQYCSVCFEAAALSFLWYKGGGEAPKKGLSTVSLVLLLSGSKLHGAWAAWRDSHAGGTMTLPVGSAVDLFIGAGEAIGATSLLWVTTRPVERSVRTLIQGVTVCFCGFLGASMLAMVSSMAVAHRALPVPGGARQGWLKRAVAKVARA